MLSYFKKIGHHRRGEGPPPTPAPTPALIPAPTPALAIPPVAVVVAPAKEHSLVLSPADEKFLEAALGDAKTNVIFPGSATPDQQEEMEEGRENVAAAEKKKEDAEWMDSLTTRWQGIRRSVSSAAQKKDVKGKGIQRSVSSAAQKKDVKGKGKETEVAPELPIIAEDKEKKQKEKVEKKSKENKKNNTQKFEREEDELSAALDQLNLSAENGHAFSLSIETRALLTSFTQILKDLSNGVPTAYDDLIKLFEVSSTTLEKTFSDLPDFIQKLIKGLPSKLKPGVIESMAAASPAMLSAEGGLIGLKELIAKPGLVMGLLKSVVNILKTRFPMLLGANAALSMALFVVLLVLWYCYKRGKEVRLEKEKEEAEEMAALLGGPSTPEKVAQTAAASNGVEADLAGGSKC